MATTIEFHEDGFTIKDDSGHPDVIVQWADFDKDRHYAIPSGRSIIMRDKQLALLETLP